MKGVEGLSDGFKPVYRICRDCRKDWNVSRLDPGGKVYICPVCERKRKEKGNDRVYQKSAPQQHG